MVRFSPAPADPSFDAVPVLKKFLDELNILLSEAITANGPLNPIYLTLAVDAHAPIPGEIARMQSALPNRTVELARHGLTGPSLRFKLQLIADQSEMYEASKAAPNAKPARGIFKKLLQFIDNLLESLVDALHLGHMIVEFKKALEGATPDDLGENK